MEMEERNRRIIRRAKKGKSVRQIGSEFNISHARAGWIISKYGRPESVYVNESEMARMLGIGIHSLIVLRKKGVLEVSRSRDIKNSLVLYDKTKKDYIKKLVSDYMTCAYCEGPKKSPSVRACSKCWQGPNRYLIELDSLR